MTIRGQCLRATLIGVALGSAAVANVVTTAAGSGAPDPRWQGFASLPSRDILDLAMRSESLKSLYGLAADLGRVSPGATIVILEPVDVLEERQIERFYGIGDADSVYRLFGGPFELAADDPFAEYIVEKGDGGRRGFPYVIAFDPAVPASERVFLLAHWQRGNDQYDETFALVEVSLVDISGEEALRPWW